MPALELLPIHLMAMLIFAGMVGGALWGLIQELFVYLEDNEPD